MLLLQCHLEKNSMYEPTIKNFWNMQMNNEYKKNIISIYMCVYWKERMFIDMLMKYVFNVIKSKETYLYWGQDDCASIRLQKKLTIFNYLVLNFFSKHLNTYLYNYFLYFKWNNYGFLFMMSEIKNCKTCRFFFYFTKYSRKTTISEWGRLNVCNKKGFKCILWVRLNSLVLISFCSNK
jgi:hypothetical protein